MKQYLQFLRTSPHPLPSSSVGPSWFNSMNLSHSQAWLQRVQLPETMGLGTCILGLVRNKNISLFGGSMGYESLPLKDMLPLSFTSGTLKLSLLTFGLDNSLWWGLSYAWRDVEQHPWPPPTNAIAYLQYDNPEHSQTLPTVLGDQISPAENHCFCETVPAEFSLICNKQKPVTEHVNDILWSLIRNSLKWDSRNSKSTYEPHVCLFFKHSF